jgi:hypothetical protein
LEDYAQTYLMGANEELISPTLPVRARVGDFFAGAPNTTLVGDTANDE